MRGAPEFLNEDCLQDTRSSHAYLLHSLPFQTGLQVATWKVGPRLAARGFDIIAGDVKSFPNTAERFSLSPIFDTQSTPNIGQYSLNQPHLVGQGQFARQFNEIIKRYGLLHTRLQINGP
ncbi:MAG: hypothetical protein HC802_04100 [Caldilineaceae bacterium]|nr:hypothetical protein [Caldilineaceae bacterium]